MLSTTGGVSSQQAPFYHKMSLLFGRQGKNEAVHFMDGHFSRHHLWLYNSEPADIPHAMHADLLKPATAATRGRVKKAGVCVKLWLVENYFLVHAIFVASKLWIWQQFNFLAGQRASLYWNCMLGKLTQHLISIYFYMLLLYCWYMLRNTIKTLFFAFITTENLSRITLFSCQILRP